MKLTLQMAQDMMDRNYGNLDLRGTKITALPDNLTVGGWLDLSGTKIKDLNIRRLQNGDYVPGNYLYADNILTHVKKKKQVGNYTYFVGKIPGKNVVFDGTYYAHCNDFRSGISDLLFKSAKDRGADQYKGLPLDTEKTVEELMVMYRVITGACQQGTNTFVDNLGSCRKDRYTIKEVIALTSGQYGSDRFAEFFGDA